MKNKSHICHIYVTHMNEFSYTYAGVVSLMCMRDSRQI